MMVSIDSCDKLMRVIFISRSDIGIPCLIFVNCCDTFIEQMFESVKIFSVEILC